MNDNNLSTAIGLGRKIIPYASTTECDTTNSDRQQCSTDCLNLLVCDSSSTDPLAVIPCPSSLPYCDNGECVKTKPTSGCPVDINCPGKDYFYPGIGII